MLTIQPNFTNQSLRRVPVFKGEPAKTSPEETAKNPPEEPKQLSPEDQYFDQKTKYYEGKKNEFENLFNDKQTPQSLKKTVRAFKIVSEILLEGWAVAWGASKGAKFVKTSVVDGVNSNFAKGTKDILTPIGKGFAAAGKKLVEVAGAGIKYVKGTSAFTKLNEGVASVITKMDNNRYGKVVLNILNKVGTGIKLAADLVAKPFKKVANSLKHTSVEETYDKAAKATSATLGVGAGVACGYNEIVHPEKAKTDDAETKKEVKEQDDNNELTEIDGEDEE